MRRPTEGLEVGRAYTLIEAGVFSPQSIVDALRDGHVEPRSATDRSTNCFDVAIVGFTSVTIPTTG